LNTNYEIVMSTGTLIKIGLTLIWGVITGQFAGKSLNKFLSASSQAGKIKAHYLKYPKNSAEFPAWAEEAKKLWKE